MALLPNNLIWIKKLKLKTFGLDKIEEHKLKSSKKISTDKGYKFFAEQYIFDVKTAESQSGNTYVKAKCYASQKKKDCHTLHVYIEQESGTILRGFCVCKAG